MVEPLHINPSLVHKACFELGGNDMPEPVNRTVKVDLRNRCRRHLIRANGTRDDLDIAAISAHERYAILGRRSLQDRFTSRHGQNPADSIQFTRWCNDTTDRAPPLGLAGLAPVHFPARAQRIALATATPNRPAAAQRDTPPATAIITRHTGLPAASCRLDYGRAGSSANHVSVSSTSLALAFPATALAMRRMCVRITVLS